MSEEELKPCPFCGSKATVQVIPPHTHKLTKWIPDCNGEVIIECKCGCSIMRDTEEEAITHWNTRKPIEKAVKELEELQQYYIYSIDDLVRLSDVKKLLKGSGVDD